MTFNDRSNSDSVASHPTHHKLSPPTNTPPPLLSPIAITTTTPPPRQSPGQPVQHRLVGRLHPESVVLEHHLHLAEVDGRIVDEAGELGGDAHLGRGGGVRGGRGVRVRGWCGEREGMVGLRWSDGVQQAGETCDCYVSTAPQHKATAPSIPLPLALLMRCSTTQCNCPSITLIQCTTRLAHALQHFHDGLRGQPHRHGRVQRVGGEAVLMDAVGAGEGLGDGDEEI